MFSFGMLYMVLIYLVAALILWLVIYTAVRAALAAHRRALAEERRRPPQ